MSDVESQKDLEMGAPKPNPQEVVKSKVDGEKSPKDPGNKAKDGKSSSGGSNELSCAEEEPSSIVWYVLIGLTLFLALGGFAFTRWGRAGVAFKATETMLGRAPPEVPRATPQEWYYTKFETKTGADNSVEWVEGKPTAFESEDCQKLLRTHNRFMKTANATSSSDAGAWHHHFRTFRTKLPKGSVTYEVKLVLGEGNVLKYAQFEVDDEAGVTTTRVRGRGAAPEGICPSIHNAFRCWIVTPPETVSKQLSEIQNRMKVSRKWRSEHFGFYPNDIQTGLTDWYDSELEKYLEDRGRFCDGYQHEIEGKFKDGKWVCKEICGLFFWVKIEEKSRGVIYRKRRIIFRHPTDPRDGKRPVNFDSLQMVYAPNEFNTWHCA